MSENGKKQKSIEYEVSQSMFFRRENNRPHHSYNHELLFYDAVKNGDLAYIEQNIVPFDNESMGQLSDDKLRNFQYHMVITIALIIRFCMEGGMDDELAYTLSDIYIQRTDHCRNCEEVVALHRKVVLDLTKRMQDIHKKNIISYKVQKCMDYISNHIHSQLSLQQLGEYVKLNPNYLCTLFKKETGISITEYMIQEKIDAARNMLRYSDFSYSDISNYLSFNSQSHFISVFKKMTGMTPGKYRLKYYETNWNSNY